MYTPKNVERPDLTLHVHGGGGFIGHSDDLTQDSYCRKLSRETRSIVLSLEYSLAPEVPYPASRIETEEFLRWVRSDEAAGPQRCPGDVRLCAKELEQSANSANEEKHPRDLAATDCWAGTGGSAGANLLFNAALRVLTHKRHDERDEAPAYLDLQYPYIGVTEQEARDANDWILQEGLLGFAYRQVFDSGRLIDNDEFHDVVAHETDLSPLQQTSIVIRAAEKEAGVKAMQRLHDAFIASSVPSRFELYPGAIHGFMVFTDNIGGEVTVKGNADLHRDLQEARQACRSKAGKRK